MGQKKPLILFQQLEGKVAIVTGASRGIGRAIARRFAMEGAKVVINYSNSQSEARTIAAEIGRMGGRYLIAKADVSQSKDVKGMVTKAYHEFKRIDVLVNNAGVQRHKDFLDSTEEDWDTVMDTNLKGAYLCCREVAKIMLKQKKGKIINISSISGTSSLQSAVRYADYVASKAGMIGLTKSLAVNLGPKINVNAICPGTIETEMIGRMLTTKSRKLTVSETPLRRLGKPEEIADAAVFLASAQSDWITGEILTVSGGR